MRVCLQQVWRQLADQRQRHVDVARRHALGDALPHLQPSRADSNAVGGEYCLITRHHALTPLTEGHLFRDKQARGRAARGGDFHSPNCQARWHCHQPAPSHTSPCTHNLCQHPVGAPTAPSQPPTAPLPACISSTSCRATVAEPPSTSRATAAAVSQCLWEAQCGGVQQCGAVLAAGKVWCSGAGAPVRRAVAKQ